MPRRALQGIKNVKVGMRLHAQTPQGPRAVTITRLVGDMVTIDANHPLAGKNLNFDVEVTEVRAATEEEARARPRARRARPSPLILSRRLTDGQKHIRDRLVFGTSGKKLTRSK